MQVIVPSRRLLLTAALLGAAAALVPRGVQSLVRHRPAPPAAMAAKAATLRDLVAPPAASAAEVSFRAGDTGFDISWPQCPAGTMPPPHTGIAVVGVNGGGPFSFNPCFAQEWAWASTSPSRSVYLNLARRAPDIGAHGWTGPKSGCASKDMGCASYDVGWSAALASVSAVAAARAAPVMWWLDVEAGDDWSCLPGCDESSDAQLVQGAIDLLHSFGLQVGIYSNPVQWAYLTGNYAPQLPVWTTDYEDASPQSHCGGPGFGGGRVVLVQSFPVVFDGDYACVTKVGAGLQG